MSHPGPRAVEIVLSGAERRALERAVADGSRRLAERAGMVLACADGLSNAAVAQRFSVSVPTASKWRSRFATPRLAGLEDGARAGSAGEDGAVPGDACADRAGVRRWHLEQAGRGGSGGERDRGEPLAVPVRRRAAGRPARRATARPATVDPARPGRGRRRGDLGGTAEGCHPLVACLDGPAQRPEYVHHRADLEEVRPQTPCPGRVQAVERPVVRGEGRRRRGSLPQPAGAGRGAVRRRESPDPGAGPVPAGAGDDARHATGGAPMTTTATASPACSRRSTSPTAP